MPQSYKRVVKDLLLFVLPWSAFITLVVNGILLRASLPSTVFVDPDSGGYFLPALSYIERGEFPLMISRSLPYPLFLLVILNFFRSLSAIAPIQHFVTIVGAAITFFSFIRLGRIFQNHVAIRVIIILFGLGYSFLFLRSIGQIFFGQSVRPEAINSAIVAFVTWLHFEIIIACFEKQSRRLLWLLPAVIFANIFSYSFRPNVGFAILVGPLLAVGAALYMGNRLRSVVLSASVGAILAYCIVLQPDKYFGRGDPQRKKFLPLALIACHAQYVLPVVKRDLDDPNFNWVNKAQLSELYSGLSEEVLDASSHPERNPYKILGVNPDNIMYRNLHIQNFIFSFPTPEEFARVAYYYFFEMLKSQTGAYLQKVSTQLSIVFGRNGQTFIGETPINLSQEYETSRRVARELPFPLGIESQRIKTEYLANVDSLLSAYANRTWMDIAVNRQRAMYAAPAYLIKLHYVETYVFPIALLLYALILGIFTTLRNSVATWRGTISVGILGALLYAYNFLHTFSVGAIGDLEIGRYIVAQYSSYLLFLSFSLLFQLIIFLELATIIAKNAACLVFRRMPFGVIHSEGSS